MNNVDLHARYVHATAAHLVEIDGEGVLLSPHDNSLHRLDAIATVVWKRFDGATKVEQICRQLADDFATDIEPVQGDVLTFIEQMRRHRLLVDVDREQPPVPAARGEKHEMATPRPLPPPPAP